MGIAFRDANVKGPLWEEVSRKMAELGFIRNAKKCKEKFENVYKYHKRTKEGRTGKSEGKTYRFFDQLEALETHHHQQQPPQPQPPLRPHNNSVFSTPPPVTSAVPPITTNITPVNLPSFPNISGEFLSDNSTSSSSSYSTSSDIEIGGGTTNRKKRKRKWKDFFERLMKTVVDKQEELQRKFLEAVEKREHERLIREESWRVQEIARINREHEILAQERSMSAAKDAAVMSFLQKLSEKQPHPQPPQPQMQLNNIQQTPQTPQPPPQTPQPPTITTLDTTKTTNGNQNVANLGIRPASAEASVAVAAAGSASRWPKVEIEALIKLRTNLDEKYQENGPKGPLWEQISAGMRRLGFNRNSKRCKEKWENINKYFKKVKESNKKRPQDSKTCPYFHQLDALYKERSNNNNKSDVINNNIGPPSSNSGLVKPDDNSVPLMVQPEQQWPPATATVTSAVAQIDQPLAQPLDQSFDDEEGTDEEYDDDEDGNEEEGEEGEFELVQSNNNKTTTN